MKNMTHSFLSARKDKVMYSNMCFCRKKKCLNSYKFYLLFYVIINPGLVPYSAPISISSNWPSLIWNYFRKFIYYPEFSANIFRYVKIVY